ncbi:Homeobox protein HOX1A [Apostasia shenzhenica]|uniref:Homeobox protein HOX1A n=1 Tax=Apostasia shenzhenica TaxID=1088818 RepID=A0A2I0AZP2_9ASPA|nr:Homeobox protein HOX1A [Apostasia shenzhenica]
MHGQKPDSSNDALSESLNAKCEKVTSEELAAQNKVNLDVVFQSKNGNTANGETEDCNKSACKEKKDLPKMLRNAYSLRSLDSSRILRSASKAVDSKSPKSARKLENLVRSTRKSGKKKGNKSGKDELYGIRARIGYLMKRMNYEQSLIDAYSSEGWKGLSLEKIRPEKELDRAKSEISRCKLKIRGTFQHLHTLQSEGRLHESLFDPDGICSENIFCGKCGSKDASNDNDIVLCDGNCERGFHQRCLNPPLLSEESEEWLCPQCNCKVDCINLLNESQGTNLSIEDSWERIFPEAAAFANGSRQSDYVNLPSDDSEDDDYDPGVPGFDIDKEEEDEEESSYEESDSSSSEVSATSGHNVNEAISKLSTDDSEDDDFDPDAPDPDTEIYKDKSDSDESDFTSDSDEFCAELVKSCANEASASSLPSSDLLADTNGHNIEHKDMSIVNPEIHCSLVEQGKQESCLRSSRKRYSERLDYGKLYAYGKASSGSSDDEEWNDMNTAKKMKKIDKKEVDEVLNCSSARTPQKLQLISAISASEKGYGHLVRHASHVSSSTVQRSQVPSKELFEAFQENHYPTREKKESLAQELGMTFQQVTRWFENARRRWRVSPDELLNTNRSDSHKLEPIYTSSQKTGLDVIQSSRSSASHLKPNNALVQESSTGATRRKDGASAEKGKEVIVNKEMNDRQKAIAKELRRIRKSR